MLLVLFAKKVQSWNYISPGFSDQVREWRGLQGEQHYFRISIEPHITSGTISHSCRDIHLPISCMGIFSFGKIPSFIPMKTSTTHQRWKLTKNMKIEGSSMRMSCEKQCGCGNSLFCRDESSEDKLETVRTMEQDDVHIIVCVIEHVDILIHEHISLLFWHLM